MKFGPVPLEEAGGAILAHSLRLADGRLGKGTVLDAQALARLRAAGLSSVTVARLEAGDLGEDEAATRVAAHVAGTGVRVEAPATGRVNLFAAHGGLLSIDAAGVDALNLIDPAITLATLDNRRPVVEGEMVATVKIIPYAVAAAKVEAAVAAAGRLVSVRPWRGRPVGVVQTRVEGTLDKMLDKTARVLAARLEASGSTIAGEWRVAHEAGAVAGAIAEARKAGAEMIVVFGASAISDIADVIPAGLEAAGGEVIHLGMPVDPGNLLLLGALDGIDVLGAPGCARSPRENGFDWVLSRLLADEKVGAADIAGLGVGGLLMEIVSRPQPREGKAAEGGGVAAVILAAGRSRRMGGRFKLTEEVGGKPLVAHAVDAAAGAGIGEIVVVTGNRADEVRAALGDRPVRFVHNEAYAEGLSTSLKAGIGALGGTCAGALVMLADMPGVDAALLTRLMNMFKTGEGTIVVPAHGGKRGNPVLWARRYFGELASLEGDTGARHLIGVHGEAVREVEAGSDAIFLDIDTPEALAAARGKPVSTP